MKTLVKEEKKETLEELEARHVLLVSQIEEYLLLLGAEYSLLSAIIEDLKTQMYMHADSRINDMIAQLINLENEILYAKENEKALLNNQNQPC